MIKKTAFTIIFSSLLMGHSLALTDITAAHREDNAVANAEEIIEMRSRLAKTIDSSSEITEETFKRVCGAVARRAQEISAGEGVKIRHATLKNRNKMTAATPEEEALIRLFEDKKKKEHWDNVTIDGAAHRRYTRPIYVEKACLACHGEKEARPRFIKDKYPDDKAYGYKEGELRGIISILLPE
ncbi:MAG TPA: DUF3365 domain-containing protein [Thermodesulfobacteriota bacterium]